MRKKFLLFLSAVLLVFFSVSCAGDYERLKVHFIDVGKGDAIFIETPRKKGVLIDTGNLITGYKVVKYINRLGIKRLENLVLTHHDLDHVGGAFFVLQMMNVKKVEDNGQDLSRWQDHSDIYLWYEDIVRHDDNYVVLKKGDRFKVDGVSFDVLWPSDTVMFPAANPNSIVIMVKYGRFRCLLMGDATIETEAELLKAKENLRASVIKIGHHGSSKASSQDLLTAVSAPVSIISVNKHGNNRGYADQSVLERIRKAGSRIYRTDVQGDIVITAQRNGRYRVKTQKSF